MIKSIKNQVMKTSREAKNSLQASYQKAPPLIQRRVKLGFLIAIVLLAVIAGVKWFQVHREENARAKEIAAGPQVRVSKILQSPGEHTVTLIGETRPFQEATLYAKVSGYLKILKVDKGDVVKQGQILAIIESAETDQAYQAAKADYTNKKAIGLRMATLFQKHLVSQQEIDQVNADAEVANARYHTQEIMKSYETIRAPFAGMITARFADPGALVQNAMTSQTSALPVVTVSTVDHLRVAVFVDQHDAAYVMKDQAVQISLSDRPGFKIEGKISRVSGELDPRTKMLLTEIDLENANQQLVAGSFVQVSIQVKSPSYLEAPVESLVMRGDKSLLTTVNDQNQIAFKPVEVASNDGKMLTLTSGVKAGDRVALNIGDSVPEGSKVRPLEDEVKKP